MFKVNGGSKSVASSNECDISRVGVFDPVDEGGVTQSVQLCHARIHQLLRSPRERYRVIGGCHVNGLLGNIE